MLPRRAGQAKDPEISDAVAGVSADRAGRGYGSGCDYVEGCEAKRICIRRPAWFGEPFRRHARRPALYRPPLLVYP